MKIGNYNKPINRQLQYMNKTINSITQKLDITESSIDEAIDTFDNYFAKEGHCRAIKEAFNKLKLEEIKND